MQPDVSWQFRLVRHGSIARQFRLMQAEFQGNDERLVLARDKKFLIGMVTIRNIIRQTRKRLSTSESMCAMYQSEDRIKKVKAKGKGKT